jgi:hypothetical protein
MKKFVIDNLAIVAAIALPLVLVALLAVSNVVTNRWCTIRSTTSWSPPTSTAVSNEAFYFDVVQNRLKISYAFPCR